MPVWLTTIAGISVIFAMIAMVAAAARGFWWSAGELPDMSVSQLALFGLFLGPLGVLFVLLWPQSPALQARLRMEMLKETRALRARNALLARENTDEKQREFEAWLKSARGQRK